jgi:hypothetical protein
VIDGVGKLDVARQLAGLSARWRREISASPADFRQTEVTVGGPLPPGRFARRDRTGHRRLDGDNWADIRANQPTMAGKAEA